MHLSQDILYHRLQSNYPAQFLNRNEADVKHSYPIIYEVGAELSDHVVVIRADDLEELLDQSVAQHAMFVCVGQMFKKKPSMPSVIIIDQNISLINVNNFLIKIYDEFEKWDHSMINVVSKGGSFQDLINCCDQIVSEPIAIIDKEFKIVAESALSKKLDYDNEADDDWNTPDDPNAASAEANRRGDLDPSTFPFTNGRHLGRTIFDKKEFVGRIAIHLSSNDEYLQNFYNAVLDHFYIHVTRLYNEYSSFEVREISNNRLATLIRSSLNKKKVSEKLWEEAFAENGWDKNSRFLLVQLVPNSMKETTIRSIYSTVLNYTADNLGSETLCFIYMERLLLLINTERLTGCSKPDPVEALVGFCRDHLLIAGISRVFGDMKYLRSAYDQAKTAIEYGTANHPSDACYRFDDYALDYMLRNCVGTFENEEICSSKLIALMQYDQEKGTDYYKTLYTYFRSRYNAAEAAKQLFINRSTFHYRLERIQELVNIDFESEEERLYLAVSCKILEQSQNNM